MIRVLKKLFDYNRGENRRFVGAYLVSLLYMLILLVPSELIRRIVESIENGDQAVLYQMPLWCLGTVFLTLVLIYAEKVLLTKALNRSEQHIQSQLLYRICTMKKCSFQKLEEGAVVTKITQNVHTAVASGYYAVYSFLVGILGLVFSFFYMAGMNVVLTLSMVFFNVAVMLITSAISKKLKHIHANVIKQNNSANQLLLDLLENMLLLRLFEEKSFWGKRFQEKEMEICKANRKAFALQNGMNETIWGGKKLAEILLIFGIGGYLVCKGSIGISIVASFTIISEPFSKILKMVVDSIFSANEAVPSIQALDELFSDEDAEEDQGETLSAGRGRIEFRNVSFSLGEKKIFDQASFVIAPGEKVLITGENGQGKSTLLHLVAGLYQPDEGSILLDGEDISKVPSWKAAEKYCYILQKSQVFFGNGYQNVTLSKEEQKEDCRELLDGLKVLPVAQQEMKVCSEGEKQRLCIARALWQLKPGKIVLGDEIFANIDRENRKGISDMLEKAFCGHTVLMVSHDREYLNYDKQLEVVCGKVFLRTVEKK